MWTKENTYTLLMGMQIRAATMETRMDVLQNLKMELVMPNQS
jgi:hypothetical protein